jgi:hypothetical protein
MTDTSNDAVARLRLAMINSGNTTTANMLTALAVDRDAANARADQARDAALVDAAGTLEDQALDAEAQAKRFRGGSDPWADRTARSRALRNSAAAILALRDKPAPEVTVRAYLLRHRDTGKEDIIDAKKYNPTKLDFWVSPAAMASVEIIPLSAIAGGGDE